MSAFRILHIGSKLGKAGGIEKYLMNLYNEIDKNEIQFDFVILEEKEKQYYEKIIEDMGGIVYNIPISKQSFIKCCYEKIKIFSKYREYGIIHIHTTCGIRALDGILAKVCGIKHVIFHSHSNIGIPPLKYKILRPVFRLVGSQWLACSTEAGEYFFGKKILNNYKFIVAKNGIPSEDFEFSIEKRESIRKNYMLSEITPIIGFVGRLSVEKNIGFTINVFNELLKYDTEAILMIIGEGPEEDNIKRIVDEYKIGANVLFLGSRNDISDFMSAFDVLLLPSYHEGLGIVLIEAQATDLKCYTSDVISRETFLSNKIEYLELEIGASRWASIINDSGYHYTRINQKSLVVSKGYDIEITAKKIFQIYTNFYKDRR